MDGIDKEIRDIQEELKKTRKTGMAEAGEAMWRFWLDILKQSLNECNENCIHRWVAIMAMEILSGKYHDSQDEILIGNTQIMDYLQICSQTTLAEWIKRGLPVYTVRRNPESRVGGTNITTKSAINSWIREKAYETSIRNIVTKPHVTELSNCKSGEVDTFDDQQCDDNRLEKE